MPDFPFNWGRRVKMTVDKTKFTADVTNFPLCLVWTGAGGSSNLPQEMMEADSGFSCLDGGGDIRFSSDFEGAVRLSCEIVKCTTNNDPTLAVAEIYVLLPAVSSSTNTVFYLWYKCAGKTQPAVNAAYGRNSVWTPRYRYAFHLPETSGGTCTDSAGAQNGDYVGDLPVNSAGLLNVGSGQTLNPIVPSAEDEVKVDAVDASGSAITLFAICKNTANAGVPPNPRLCEKLGISFYQRLRINTSVVPGTAEFGVRAGGASTNCTSTGVVYDDTWCLFGGTYDGSNIRVWHYDNGADDGNPGTQAKTGALNVDPGADFAFGGRGAIIGANWYGALEEFRYSNNALTAGEFSAIWKNYDVPENMLTIGTPDTPVSSCGLIMYSGLINR